MTPQAPKAPPAQSWLDRLTATGPRTRRWVTLASVWVVVTPGAILILLQPNEALRQAVSLGEKLRAIKLEEWLALVLIGLHLLFLNLAWLSYLSERDSAQRQEPK